MNEQLRYSARSCGTDDKLPVGKTSRFIFEERNKWDITREFIEPSVWLEFGLFQKSTGLVQESLPPFRLEVSYCGNSAQKESVVP